MDGVELRDFTEDDIDWVLSVMVESLKATLTPERLAKAEPSTLVNDAKRDFDRFHYQTQKPDKAVIAWRGDSRIGFVWITTNMPVHENSNSAWLLDIYVVPEFRHRGLARELLKVAEHWAASQGANELWLNVGGGNQKALSLYEAQGFRVETMHLCKKL